LQELHSENPIIEIKETAEKIKIPLKVLKILAEILKTTGQGKPISIIQNAPEITTQAAAELLGCSGPHLVKLLKNGVIPFTMVGRHRRVKFEDVTDYQTATKLKQEQFLIRMIKSDEELELYDSK
jgi:excisionase family DNA binding protein